MTTVPSLPTPDHQLDYLLAPGPTRIMAIVNLTTDSFADKVRHSITSAIEAGIAMWEQGADVIDVGGESTRPGAERVPPEQEAARVVPVVAALASVGIAVSVDTVRARVAEAALEAGALMVNDVSGGLSDPAILRVTADARAGYVLQHWRVPFDHRPSHTDVVAEVRGELAERAERALSAGLPPDRIILDPGIGFGKTADDNWQLLSHCDEVSPSGLRVCWGVSRKRFLADLYPEGTPPWGRDAAGVALTALLARHNVWAVRVHTVPDHRAAIAVANALG